MGSNGDDDGKAETDTWKISRLSCHYNISMTLFMLV